MKMQSNRHLIGAILMTLLSLARAQEENNASCYGSGTIALAVILSIILTALFVLGAIYFLYRRRNSKDHLILETDPERGKEDYAFDNPGFKDASTISAKKSVLDNSFPKWSQWSPLSALSTKSEKRRALDDSAIEKSEVKVVALRSHDFTGLGFNICGNIKEGIYIKDILHRGPAFESGKLNPGDKITSVTISFEHMVCEDALTILSYASPYEVIIEARSGKIMHNDGGVGGQPGHPVYRSSSCTNLNIGDKSDYSSLQKSKSTMPTLERNKSKSPNLIIPKKQNPLKNISPKQLKTQLEQKIMPEKTEMETQKTENKYQKFGVKVLPLEQQKSPKTNELQQNDNNINIEKYTEQSIDEVDESKLSVTAPPIKRREKKSDKSEEFVKSNLNSSIKRDKDGIPQEIPSHMFNAAVMAQRNRKNSIENSVDEISKATKKPKGKAPPPPPEEKPISSKKYDEIQSLSDESIDLQERKTPIKDYNSDSDIETDNHSSVNTIELNPNDITIHQAEDENLQSRKTASTGDLSKMQQSSSSIGTLERAQSLDITDSSAKSSLKRKGDDIFDVKFDEDFGKVMQNKAPRLSLILDSLNTFERRTLKKSTEWGNLEDAILKLNHEENHSPDIMTDFGEKTPEFDAVVKKINEIRRESKENIEETVAKNEIWPNEMNNDDEKTVDEEIDIIVPERNKYLSSTHIEDNTSNSIEEPSLVDEIMVELNEEKSPVNNIIWPTEPVEEEIIESQEVITEHDCIPSHSEKEIEEELKNSPDEVKEFVKPLDNIPGITETFLFNEKVYNHFDDTNVSDDIKVSRSSYESLERNNYLPKSDDAKSEDSFKNISNVTINNGDTELHSLELSINETGDMYTTALETPIQSTIRISSPKSVTNDSPTLIGSENTSLTYITEIKVTPNISEIEIVPDERNLESAFENYVRKFSNVEPNVPNFNIEEFIKEDDPPHTIHINNSTQIDGEKEMHKIHELAEEQLKKLPEMKFVTSSYDNNSKPNESKSHIELLRMNFEKKSSPVKPETPIKSRIPVAMSAMMTKSPPISPERRTSVENNENDKAIIELMSTNAVHSTPIVTQTMKYQKATSPNKNITVTSIRNSKIPSGLPTLSGSRLTARKIELNDNESTENGNVRSITNISLPESKFRKT